MQLNNIRKARIVPQGRLDPAIQYASHLAKPQLKFKSKPNNDRNFLWQPFLKHKYNAQVPLGHNLQDDAVRSASM
jgi:exosome complex exonuclease RRP6